MPSVLRAASWNFFPTEPNFSIRFSLAPAVTSSRTPNAPQTQTATISARHRQSKSPDEQRGSKRLESMRQGVGSLTLGGRAGRRGGDHVWVRPGWRHDRRRRRGDVLRGQARVRRVLRRRGVRVGTKSLGIHRRLDRWVGWQEGDRGGDCQTGAWRGWLIGRSQGVDSERVTAGRRSASGLLAPDGLTRTGIRCCNRGRDAPALCILASGLDFFSILVFFQLIFKK
jgi:hypothetical protein